MSRGCPARRRHARALARAGLALICLDAAFALLVALAAHPPKRPAELHMALAPEPVAPSPRALASAEPAPPPRPLPYEITVPIRMPAHPTPDLAALTDDAVASAPSGPAHGDEIAPARVASMLAEPSPFTASTRADRLAVAPEALAMLVELAPLGRPLADRLAPTPVARPIEVAREFVTHAPSAVDRLIALAAWSVAESGVLATPRADRLPASALPSAAALVDETAWSAVARAGSSEPLRLELMPTARPSPAVLLARWLPELGAPARSAELKTEFVRLLLPLVMRVNEEILRRRERAVALAAEIDAGHELTTADERAAAALLQETRLDSWDTGELLLRLDAVPLSMALAQAAQESGWGRSRPAREDNALFGQMMFPPVLPPQLQPFDDLLETVTAYVRNLNTHRAYAEFRRRRAELRARGDMLDGRALVDFIQRYSERGVRYIAAIRELMRMNNLTLLDASVLDAALEASPLAGAVLNGAPLERVLVTEPLGPGPFESGPFEAETPAQRIDN